MLFYRSSVTAYERCVMVSYVVLQVMSHSIRTSHDGKVCCSTGHHSEHKTAEHTHFCIFITFTNCTHTTGINSCLSAGINRLQKKHLLSIFYRLRHIGVRKLICTEINTQGHHQCCQSKGQLGVPISDI